MNEASPDFRAQWSASLSECVWLTMVRKSRLYVMNRFHEIDTVARSYYSNQHVSTLIHATQYPVIHSVHRVVFFWIWRSSLTFWTTLTLNYRREINHPWLSSDSACGLQSESSWTVVACCYRLPPAASGRTHGVINPDVTGRILLKMWHIAVVTWQKHQ